MSVRERASNAVRLECPRLLEKYAAFSREPSYRAEDLAFRIEKEIIVTEGDSIWISQILILAK